MTPAAHLPLEGSILQLRDPLQGRPLPPDISWFLSQKGHSCGGSYLCPRITPFFLFFLIYFLLLFNYSCMPFLPFPPRTPAEPTSLPRFCPCVLYNSSCNPLFPLSPPHSPLATARQFPLSMSLVVFCLLFSPTSSLWPHGLSLRQTKFAGISSPATFVCLGGAPSHSWGFSLSVLLGRREESCFGCLHDILGVEALQTGLGIHIQCPVLPKYLFFMFFIVFL